MPRGIPVATVAIGNSANAGLLAIRILASGVSSPSSLATVAKDVDILSQSCNSSTISFNMLQKMTKFMESQEDEVLEKAAKLETVGYKDYLS
jgi:phosphoribosylaminoimidazole carboxylase